MARAAVRLRPGREKLIDAVGSRLKSVALARRTLSDAHTDFDDAVRSLPKIDGETVMASSNLVDLLVRVLAARRHLEDVERRPTSAPPASAP